MARQYFSRLAIRRKAFQAKPMNRHGSCRQLDFYMEMLSSGGIVIFQHEHMVEACELIERSFV
jgi:hypothetical protein